MRAESRMQCPRSRIDRVPLAPRWRRRARVGAPERSCSIAVMRTVWLAVAWSVAACGAVKTPAADANVDAADIDAPACQPRVLLAGGSDVAAQGWSVVTQVPAQLTNGPDYANLKTTTNMGATVSGQLLLNYPGAV